MNETQIRKLESIQTLCQHLITRCKSSTPKIVLNLLLNTGTIKSQIETTALKRALTLKTEGHWPVSQEQNTYIKTTQQKIDHHLKVDVKINRTLVTDKIAPISNINKHFKTQISDRNNIRINNPEENILIYTDGSKSENKTGYGVYFANIEIGNIACPMNSYNTVYQTEATAITAACNELLKNNIENENITIYSDSKSVILSLEKRIVKNSYIKECVETINKIGETNEVTIAWIPGHTGYEGNESADALAKAGSTKQIDKEIFVMPHTLIHTKIKEYYINKTLEIYRNTPLVHLITMQKRSQTNLSLHATKTPKKLAK